MKSFNYTIICVIISFWSVAQTILHLLFILYGYYMKTCAEKPKDASTIFFYLTYLYESRCGKLEIKSSKLSVLEDLFSTIFNMTSSEDDRISLTRIINEILLKAKLPKQAPEAPKTFHYFIGFIVLDSFWIVASAALLMASCCRIKEKSALFFYCPWLLTTICTMIFDAATSIHFGLDIPETINFHNWVKFVGILNPEDLKELDSLKTSKRLSAYPTISVLLLTSRGLVFWIINLICVIFVYKACKIAYQQSYKTERGSKRNNPSITTSNPGDNNQDSPPRITRNTSEDRIRSWQLFYGAVESTSSSHDEGNNDQPDTDINSNKPGKEANVSSATWVIPRESQSSPPSVCVTPTTPSGFYYAYSDVAEGVLEGGENVFMEELRGQRPWSYFAGEDRGKVEEAVVENTKRIRIRSAESVISS